MLKLEFYMYVILKYALAAGSKELGRSTTFPALEGFLAEAGLDTIGRDAMDALMLLSERKKIVLKKVHNNANLSFTVYDYAEYPQRQFFCGQFNIRVTAEGAAYFNELDAKVCATMQLAARPKRPGIGFGA